MNIQYSMITILLGIGLSRQHLYVIASTEEPDGTTEVEDLADCPEAEPAPELILCPDGITQVEDENDCPDKRTEVKEYKKRDM